MLLLAFLNVEIGSLTGKENVGRIKFSFLLSLSKALASYSSFSRSLSSLSIPWFASMLKGVYSASPFTDET